MTGRSRRAQGGGRRVERRVLGTDPPVPIRPSGVAAATSLGSTCTSSGKTRCATPRPSTACLTARAASSAWSLPASTVAFQTDTSRNTAWQVEVLERAAAEHARRHLPGDGQHRRAVELGVVQAGEQVRRARAGDGEARRRPPGELAVGAGRERRGTLVADADVPELAALLGPAHRVGEAEVGVADHAEHGVDAVGHQRLDHDVGDRSARGSCAGSRDVHAVLALLDAVRRRPRR